MLDAAGVDAPELTDTLESQNISLLYQLFRQGFLHNTLDELEALGITLRRRPYARDVTGESYRRLVKDLQKVEELSTLLASEGYPTSAAEKVAAMMHIMKAYNFIASKRREFHLDPRYESLSDYPSYDGDDSRPRVSSPRRFLPQSFQHEAPVAPAPYSFAPPVAPAPQEVE